MEKEFHLLLFHQITFSMEQDLLLKTLIFHIICGNILAILVSTYLNQEDLKTVKVQLEFSMFMNKKVIICSANIAGWATLHKLYYYYTYISWPHFVHSKTCL